MDASNFSFGERRMGDAERDNSADIIRVILLWPGGERPGRNLITPVELFVAGRFGSALKFPTDSIVALPH
jgi:hypothetical protein